jgi:hypothetical protein
MKIHSRFTARTLFAFVTVAVSVERRNVAGYVTVHTVRFEPRPRPDAMDGRGAESGGRSHFATGPLGAPVIGFLLCFFSTRGLYLWCHRARLAADMTAFQSDWLGQPIPCMHGDPGGWPRRD